LAPFAFSIRQRGGCIHRLAAFTLIEIFSAIVIILILITLLLPAYDTIRARMDKVACMNNLRQLYVAGGAYIQEYGQWPQIDPHLLKQQDGAYDEAWIETFVPFGVTRTSWICPTIERDLGGPDYTQKANYRTDYIAMPFDTKHLTPYKWPTSPWFVERGNVHGNGNLLVQSNGAVVELTQLNNTPQPTGLPSP
jgi:type II secretory pathway pseudopilin PulG